MNDKPIFDLFRLKKREWTGKQVGLNDHEVFQIQAAVSEALGTVPTADGTQGLAGAASGAGGPQIAPQGTFDRAAMRAELIRDEGERLRAYKDTVGKWTIGVGRNLDDVGILPHEIEKLGINTASARANGITKEQSAALLDSDIDRVVRDLDRKLPWWRGLDPVRQRVMVNMAFNLGIGGLLGFANTLAMVERGSYVQAARNMLLSKWAGQVGARAQRLSNMMKDGRA